MKKSMNLWYISAILLYTAAPCLKLQMEYPDFSSLKSRLKELSKSTYQLISLLNGFPIRSIAYTKEILKIAHVSQELGLNCFPLN